MNSKCKPEKDMVIPRAEISVEHCKGCGLCILSCPKKALRKSGKFNKHGFDYTICNNSDCIGCGICFYSCPEPGAITVYKKGK